MLPGNILSGPSIFSSKSWIKTDKGIGRMTCQWTGGDTSLYQQPERTEETSLWRAHLK